MNWLNGKKTHICMLALAVVAFLEGAFGLDVSDSIKLAIAALGGISLRSGISKAEKASKDEKTV